MVAHVSLRIFMESTISHVCLGDNPAKTVKMKKTLQVAYLYAQRFAPNALYMFFLRSWWRSGCQNMRHGLTTCVNGAKARPKCIPAAVNAVSQNKTKIKARMPRSNDAGHCSFFSTGNDHKPAQNSWAMEIRSACYDWTFVQWINFKYEYHINQNRISTFHFMKLKGVKLKIWLSHFWENLSRPDKNYDTLLTAQESGKCSRIKPRSRQGCHDPTMLVTAVSIALETTTNQHRIAGPRRYAVHAMTEHSYKREQYFHVSLHEAKLGTSATEWIHCMKIWLSRFEKIFHNQTKIMIHCLLHKKSVISVAE